jgi:diguanylate cyclase (GGDEF)-like protein
MTRRRSNELGPANPPTDTLARSHTRRYHLGLLAAVLLTVGGMGASVVGAGLVTANDNGKMRASFARTSSAVAAGLQLALQGENDLAINAGGYLVANPNGSQADFLRWSASVQLLERYPEVEGVGALVIVTASQLPSFAARMTANPVNGSHSHAPFTVTPAGSRPYYCLAPLGQSRDSTAVTPAGLDYCAGLSALVLLSARDTGRGSYVPYAAGKQVTLAVETPVYTGGVVPATVAARRAQFAGWVGTQVDPAVVLNEALENHPGMSVSMSYRGGFSQAVFTSGASAAGASSLSINLHNGWTIQTFGHVPSRGILTDGTALRLLITGLVLSVLIGMLVFVLGTGRERAHRLVTVRTGELRHQALHDALTGLPNRALVMDRIDQLLVRNRRHGTIGGALFVDLDDFKNVNDTLGHQAGDRLLIAVGARLESTLREADTIGRMGGDEFVVLIDGVTAEITAELVAERLIDVMRQPFDVDGASMPIIVSVSIGVALGDRVTAGDLLRDADVALYQAKGAGKNRYEIFHPEMQTTIGRRIDLEFDLRSALAEDQFRLVYQPIYNLDDLAIVGVEALLRWNHPAEGLVSPDEFIPILEDSGQIRDVGRWVLRTACEQMADWHARGESLDVSVNLSGRQLDDDSIVADIRNALDHSGLKATSLIIEITETALMRNADATARRLHAIKELGVRIAVDDFGTGYSSLAYLRQFPVDCLKIDRMFTSAITTSPESKALIGTLVQLGKDLGLSTLAEGVETTDEMDLLRGAKVDQAQGFLLSRPLEAGALETQLLVPTRPPHISPQTPV